MFIPALFRRIYIPVNMGRVFLDRLLIHIIKFHGICCHADDLFIFNEINISCVFQDCRYIGCDNTSPLCMTDDQGTVLSHGIKLIRMILKQNTKGIGSLHPVHDLCDRLKRISFIIVVQQMGDHFGICIGYKFIPLCLQLLFQFQIILNDPVMYHNDTLLFIKMRMRVHIGRFSVCCPACMPDPDRSRKRFSPMRQLTQHFQSALCFFHTDLFPVIYCDPCRIISPVFQFFQTIQQDRRCLLLSDITYNSTHNLFLPFLSVM